MEGFLKVDLLINHLTDHHLHLKCNLCSQKFLSEKLLNLHMTKIHLKTNYQRNNNNLSSINQSMPIIKKVESLATIPEIKDCFVLLERYVTPPDYVKNEKESLKSLVCKIEMDTNEQDYDVNDYMHDDSMSSSISNENLSYKNSNKGVIGKKKIRPSRQMRSMFRKYYLTYKSYTCDYCEKIFPTKLKLRIHIRYHVRVKCSICSSNQSASNIHRHFTKKHNVMYQRFYCNYCTKSYSEQYHLNLHMNEHNQKETFKCDFCNISFSTKMTYQTHCYRHKKFGFENRLIEYVCEICNDKFDRRDYFKRHMRSVHHKDMSNFEQNSINDANTTEKKTRCPNAKDTSIKFEHISLLDEKPANMELDIVKKSKAELKNSVRTNKNRKKYGRKQKFSNCGSNPSFGSYSCDICSKLFSVKKYLRVHIKSHVKVQCTTCLKLVSFGGLRKHILSKHKNNNQRYQCNHCDKSYSDQYALKEHMNEHIDNKIIYKCELCKISYSNKPAYRNHCVRHKKWGFDNKPLEFVCKVCKQVFERIDHLKLHMRKMHIDEISDKKSVNGNDNNEKLNESKKKIELALQRVSKFSSLSIRKCLPSAFGELNKKTIEITSEKNAQPIKDKNNVMINETTANRPATSLLPLANAEIKNGVNCSICDKTFFNERKLKRHEKIHGEKSFLCVICSKTFHHRYNLNNHLNSHKKDAEHICIMCKAEFASPLLLDRHVRNQHL